MIVCMIKYFTIQKITKKNWASCCSVPNHEVGKSRGHSFANVLFVCLFVLVF